LKTLGGFPAFLLPVILRFADLRLKRHLFSAADPATAQRKCFDHLIRCGKKTVFGREHGFDRIKTHADFVREVPIMDYEKLYPYIQRILEGEKDVLWPGRPVALASTSGTSMGPIKYIPVTKASAPAYRKTSRDSVLAYTARTGNAGVLAGKMIFMSQNPERDSVAGIPVAPISGVSMARVPRFFRKNLLPSPRVACIENWDEKMNAILDEAIEQNVTLIGGIPPWLLLFFEHIRQRTGKKVGELFPGLGVLVHGGVNFEPYQSAMEDAIGRPVDFIETYAATEGFIAFQDNVPFPGMLINLMGNLFYEFIPADEMTARNPSRLRLEEVETGQNYGILLTSTAGLWAYDIGDMVTFVSKNPYRLSVAGRSKHFISAFGEHVITEQVESALVEVLALMRLEVNDFTVSPCMKPLDGGLGYHEWFIEFKASPEKIDHFSAELDARMRQKNMIYDDLVSRKAIRPLKVRPVRRHGFKDYMDAIGRLGGQNKVPRLLNDRRVADALSRYIATT
jgi:hypothetical protein